MKVEEGDWVADVGSGEGTYSLPMAKAVGDAGRVFAVDIDDDALESLHEKMKEQGVDNVTPVLSTPYNPTLPRDEFDALLVRNAYHEFGAPKRMLRHFRSALKPNGRLVLVEYIHDERIDATRSAQTEEHDLALRYAREELRDTGFGIVRRVDTLRYLQLYDTRYWMLVATPSPVRAEDSSIRLPAKTS